MLIDYAQLEKLRLARFEIVLRADGETFLPPLLGSTLRGAFGHEWKAVACAASAGKRGECLLATNCQKPANCLYADFFEPAGASDKKLSARQQDPPRPFIFQPPVLPPAVFGEIRGFRLQKGDSLIFGLTVFGRFIEQSSYFLNAVELAAQRGFGIGRHRFALEDVRVLGEYGEKKTIQEQATTNLAELVKTRLALIDCNRPLKLRWLTPLRLRVAGGTRKTFHFGDLVKSLSRRLATLGEMYGDAPLEYDYELLLVKSRLVRTVSDDLWLFDGSRYSSRQEKKIPQDGLVGEITFAGAEILELLPVLVAENFCKLEAEPVSVSDATKLFNIMSANLPDHKFFDFLAKLILTMKNESAKKLTLLNAAIVTSFGDFRFVPLTLGEAQMLIEEFADAGKEIESAIGHAATAEIVSELLKIPVPVNRIEFYQTTTDAALIFKLKNRVAEGKVLNRAEIEQIGFEFGILTKTRSEK